ncbi:hypothetical protein HII31_12937 [Pseudocercospora fuligena]|uniref:F-box domain-containing protein n=1 Tax=Pseudocercospora fuligena TaxID=685502 RepID=A0A8H6R915_9PEZI|nr:hypothetical protein HII31_12937 [Pseudocercospora fuligena]
MLAKTSVFQRAGQIRLRFSFFPNLVGILPYIQNQDTPSTANMAATKVFKIGELAEAILIQLPTRDLLLAQRVCKAIKHTIDKSKPIQKALFFLPGDRIDPNVHEDFTMSIESAKEITSKSRAGCHPKSIEKTGLTLNPLLVKRLTLNELPEWPEQEKCGQFANMLKTRLIKSPPEASCRRMFISQPPQVFQTTSIDLRWPGEVSFYQFEGPNSRNRCPMGLGMGVTMEQLIDKMEECVKKKYSTSKEILTMARWPFCFAEVISYEEMYERAADHFGLEDPEWAV